MSNSLESRIELKAAALRMKFDRRVALTSFAACFVMSSAYFLWLDPHQLAKLTKPVAFAFTLLGIPAVSLLFFFVLRIGMAPFIEGYYEWFRRKWNLDRAVSSVLADELAGRSPGYLSTATDLLRTYQPAPVLILPVANEAFQRLLQSEMPQEALELGERLGLPREVANQARRLLLADWQTPEGQTDASHVAEAKAAVARLLSEYEAIDGLLRGFVAGELTHVDAVFKQIQEYAARLGPIECAPMEAMRRMFPPLTVLRVAQVHTLMGQAFLARGEQFQARTHLERATELNPDDPHNRLILSRLHYQQANYPMAVAVIEAHLMKFPDDLVARFHMEDCVRSLGKGARP